MLVKFERPVKLWSSVEKKHLIYKIGEHEIKREDVKDLKFFNDLVAEKGAFIIRDVNLKSESVKKAEKKAEKEVKA